MQRAIEGFHQDEHGDWVAALRCGHGQHVRHKPPFWTREWVLTAEGRAAKLGVELPCLLCDRGEMPRGFAEYKRTPDFTAASIPDGLRQHHATKRGVWGVLHVLAGHVRYVVEPPLASERMVGAGESAVIVAEALHRVVPDDDARFFVAFWKMA